MRGIVLYIYEDICKEMMLLMIKAVLNNDILRMITNIEQNKFTLNNIKLPAITRNKLRKNSKKKSSYASNKIEGNPLTEKQVSDVIDKDEHKHFLKPEQEVRNYYMALNYLEEQIAKKAPFTKELILKVQSIVEKGASKEKIGWAPPSTSIIDNLLCPKATTSSVKKPSPSGPRWAMTSPIFLIIIFFSFFFLLSINPTIPHINISPPMLSNNYFGILLYNAIIFFSSLKNV